MNKLLLTAAILLSNIFVLQAAELTRSQQATQYARQLTNKLELDEQQFIIIRNLKLADLEALEGNQASDQQAALDENLN